MVALIQDHSPRQIGHHLDSTVRTDSRILEQSYGGRFRRVRTRKYLLHLSRLKLCCRSRSVSTAQQSFLRLRIQAVHRATMSSHLGHCEGR